MSEIETTTDPQNRDRVAQGFVDENRRDFQIDENAAKVAFRKLFRQTAPGLDELDEETLRAVAIEPAFYEPRVCNKDNGRYVLDVWDFTIALTKTGRGSARSGLLTIMGTQRQEMALEPPKEGTPHMTPEAIKPEAIVASCRGYANAIGAALQVNRALWSAGAAGQAEGKAPRKKSSSYRYVSETGLRAAFLRSVREEGPSDTSDPDSLLTQFLARLQQAGLCGPEVEDSRRFDLDVFQPLRLVRETLGGLRPDHDLRYFVSRSLRSHYRCVLSPDTALAFQTLAETTNVLASERQAEVTGTAPIGTMRANSYRRW